MVPRVWLTIFLIPTARMETFSHTAQRTTPPALPGLRTSRLTPPPGRQEHVSKRKRPAAGSHRHIIDDSSDAESSSNDDDGGEDAYPRKQVWPRRGTPPAKKGATKSAAFAVQARRNGILDPRRSKPPSNLVAIQERHARSRQSASPPESRFRYHTNRVEAACNGATLVVEGSRHLLKEYEEDEGYHQVFSHSFTGFPEDVGFNHHLGPPHPDFVEGLEMEEFRPVPIEDHIKGSVLYNGTPNSLALAHLAGEWKGSGRDMEEARLQSALDGAALVYARNQALEYIDRPDPPGHAAVTTFTTDGASLHLFAHYAAPSLDDDGTLEYHQYPCASFNLKKYQEFKDGRRALRNQQDSARERSYGMRNMLRAHWRHLYGGALRPGELGYPPPAPF